MWVRRTGIASPDWEVVLLRTFERFRLGYGETRSLEAARAQLFRKDESSECAGTLLLVLLAEWTFISCIHLVIGLRSSMVIIISV